MKKIIFLTMFVSSLGLAQQDLQYRGASESHAEFDKVEGLLVYVRSDQLETLAQAESELTWPIRKTLSPSSDESVLDPYYKYLTRVGKSMLDANSQKYTVKRIVEGYEVYARNNPTSNQSAPQTSEVSSVRVHGSTN